MGSEVQAGDWGGRKEVIGAVLALLAFAVGGIVVQRVLVPEATAEQVFGEQTLSDEIRENADAAAVALGGEFAGISAKTEAMAADLNSGALALADVQTRWQSELAEQTSLFGMGAMGFADGAPFFVGRLRRSDGVQYPVPLPSGAGPAADAEVAAKSVASLATYTRDTAWFHRAQFEGGAWYPPQTLFGTPEEIVIYSTPICFGGCDLKERPPDGVLAALVSLRALDYLVRNLDLGAGAEPFVVDASGALLVHGQMDLVRRRTSAHVQAWEVGDHALGEALVDVSDGRGGELGPRDDPGSGKREFLLWRPMVDAAGDATHGLVVHLPIPETIPPEQMRHWLVFRVTGGVPILVLLVILVLLLRVRSPEHLAWWAATALAVGAVVTIVGLWYAAAKHPSPPAPNDQPILSAADLANFQESWSESTEDASFVPTGIFMQSLEFQSANNVTIAGLVWQRFKSEDCDPKAPPEHPDEPDFIFPEADPGEELQISPAYSRCSTDGREHVLGWRFRALLRQDFDYLLYPFDPQEIWVRVLPREFDKNIVLVPDLLAYDRIGRSALPGLDHEVILPGWELAGSGFAYRRRAYDTDFGISDYVGQTEFPELVYTISLRRSFLGPFVGKIIPLAVAAAMLFCMLLLGTRREKFEGAFGFTALEVVLGAAALFFVVIFDHSALRDDLATTKPFYLEYFYFAMYVALVSVCANAILFAMERGRIIMFRDNLIPKIAFWPAYMLGIALVTAVIFW